MKKSSIGLVLLAIMVFPPLLVAQSERDRSAVIEKLLDSEPEVGRFLAQWYDTEMKKIENMKQAKNH